MLCAGIPELCNGATPSLCRLCNKHFCNLNDLLSHELNFHVKKDSLHQCKVCHVKLSSAQSLADHTNLHSGKRPYECKCGKKFASKSALREHSKTERPYKCRICEQKGKTTRFKNQSKLKRHMQVHFGPKRKYRCAFCSYESTTTYNLKAHQARKHGIVFPNSFKAQTRAYMRRNPGKSTKPAWSLCIRSISTEYSGILEAAVQAATIAATSTTMASDAFVYPLKQEYVRAMAIKSCVQALEETSKQLGSVRKRQQELGLEICEELVTTDIDKCDLNVF